VNAEDYRDIRIFAWCVAEAWAAGHFDSAEEWACSAWDIADGRVFVDDGRIPEEEHPGVTS
jgi:hypothetical protein